MRILKEKPKTNVEKSNGSFQTSTVIYSDTIVTYSDPNTLYGGFFGASELGPTLTYVIEDKPFIRNAELEQPK